MATLLEFFNYDIETLGKIGVYSIHHVKYPKNLYVGSTGKRKKCNRKTHHGFYKRFYDHVRTLNLNIHHSKYLQNIVNKYGIEGLIFSILEICDELSNEQIFIREQYYINLFKPVYNSFNTVHPQGRIWTDEDKMKTSDKMKGKALSKHIYEAIRKPIYQFNMEGELLNTYLSKAEAAKILNIDPSSMSNAACGKRKSAGGFKWSYIKPK